jgi:hypothetical protein
MKLCCHWAAAECGVPWDMAVGRAGGGYLVQQQQQQLIHWSVRVKSVTSAREVRYMWEVSFHMLFQVVEGACCYMQDLSHVGCCWKLHS